jgi:SnoaL-like domain
MGTRHDEATLLDKLACRTLQETYSYAEIVRDPDLFASIWTEDAQFGSIQGRANIREAAVGFFKDMESITELRISPAGWHVDVEGDNGTGHFFVVSQLKVPQPDGTTRILHHDASYRTEFVRTADGWRISRMGGIKDPSLFHDTDIKAQIPYEEVSF